MNNANDPAFPCDPDVNGNELGVTKRELFAAMAMQGVLANPDWTSQANSQAEEVSMAVGYAVMAADALIAKLNETST